MSGHGYLPLAAVICLFFVSAAGGYASAQPAIQQPVLDCTECHTCEAPTSVDKCLRSCPSFTMAHVTSEHQLSEAPVTVVLDLLADHYQPVQFDHQAHAGMAEMGLHCATCHHYSPPGHIPPCRECHGTEANPGNLRQPALKGAYHRQCLSCHREWSHDTRCILCHLPAEGELLSAAVDSTDILGASHPVITVPDKKIYHTLFDDGEIVTFYHTQHVELYGLRCVNCHQEENCSNCHDLDRPVVSVESGRKSMEEVHAICSDCHADDDCGKCHDSREKPPFSHALTGWGLGRFHEQLDCRACHPSGKPIGRLENRCVSCHAGWDQDNFQHAVTGLQLDEVHREAACEDCHWDKEYAQAPNCSECHDDDRSGRKMPPGKYINRP